MPKYWLTNYKNNHNGMRMNYVVTPHSADIHQHININSCVKIKTRFKQAHHVMKPSISNTTPHHTPGVHQSGWTSCYRRARSTRRAALPNATLDVPASVRSCRTSCCSQGCDTRVPSSCCHPHGRHPYSWGRCMPLVEAVSCQSPWSGSRLAVVPLGPDSLDLQLTPPT